MGRRAVAAASVLTAILAAAGVVQAQRYFREGSFAARWAPAQMPDSSFVICRVAYRSVRMEYSGIGWQTDYPYAEINLTTRLSELTKTRVSRDDSSQPNFYVVRLTDDQLFNCPITVMSDAGTIGIREDEADRLRTYLLKGGFLWADDFWGTAAWEQWETEIAKVLPPQRRAGNLRARSGQRDRALQGDSRQAAQSDGGDDAQHRRRGFVGARGRGSRVLLSVLTSWLRARDRCADPHPDALTTKLRRHEVHEELNQTLGVLRILAFVV